MSNLTDPLVQIGDVSRRDALRSIALAVTVVAGGQLKLEAAQQVHAHAREEKSKTGSYKAKLFSEHEFKTLGRLAELIVPADSVSGSARDAGAPEFIDLLTSENKDYQAVLGGGIMWLDGACIDRYGKVYLDCAPEQQKAILDKIAYRKNAAADSSLSQGVQFFSFLRNMTADGFFTSEIGIKYLGYIGNTFVKEFPGCPAVPEA